MLVEHVDEIKRQRKRYAFQTNCIWPNIRRNLFFEFIVIGRNRSCTQNNFELHASIFIIIYTEMLKKFYNKKRSWTKQEQEKEKKLLSYP